MNLLPKLIQSQHAGGDQSIHFAPIISELAPLETSVVLTRLKTGLTGLSAGDAAKRLTETGPNVVAANAHIKFMLGCVVSRNDRVGRAEHIYFVPTVISVERKVADKEIIESDRSTVSHYAVG